MKYISKNENDTRQIAEKFVENLLKTRGKNVDSAMVIALQGNLGAGKTTFTQHVARALGITDTISSPTFVIEKTYRIPTRKGILSGFTHLIHIDAYRLDSREELDSLGWEEITESPENLVFLEWPEKVTGAVPRGAKKVNLRFIDERTREIIF